MVCSEFLTGYDGSLATTIIIITTRDWRRHKGLKNVYVSRLLSAHGTASAAVAATGDCDDGDGVTATRRTN